MELDNVMHIKYWLSDCPGCWKNFRYWHDGRNISWKDTLDTDYSAYVANEHSFNDVMVIFPNKEEKVRFILTWN